VTRVLLLATTTGYQIRSFGEAAEKLGVRLVFASDRCDRLEDPWWDQAIPIRFHDERHSVDAVVAACADAPLAGVLAVGDRPAILAAHMAEALGLRGNAPAAAQASRNKLASRRAFSAAGLLTPAFSEVSIADDPSVLAASCGYPAVIKPLSLSGSRGVMRVDDAGAFVQAFERLRRLLQSPDILVERDVVHGQALVEAYVPGKEFAIEGVLTDGVFRAFAIFDKPDPLVGPFFEETIYVTPSRAPRAVQQAIVAHIARAARALGLRHGPVHAECRVNSRGVYVLEVAPRPIGGLCSKALRLRVGDVPQTSASLEEVLLRHVLGEDISGYEPEPLASGVMMIPIPRRGVYRGVSGVNQARAVAGVSDVRMTAKADEVLVPLPEGHSYLGFIFASLDHPAAVEQALRDAHSKLTFTIGREIELAPR
jgi:formate-dependent phosphoribosylglycinamide formyltransferase (GAR transformylase)